MAVKKKTTTKNKTTKTKSKKTKKTSKSRKKSNNDDTETYSGIVIVDDDLTINKEAALEERKAFLEEARSQEATSD